MPQRPPKSADREAQPRRKIKAEPKPDLWARPPIPELGNKDRKVLFAAIGAALTAWEALEMEFAGVFDSFMGDNVSHAAHRAYGAVTISSVRRDMLVAATEAHFLWYPELRGELEAAIKAAITLHERLSSRRNDIAHGIVQRHSARFGSTNETWYLFPAYTSTKAVNMKEEGPTKTRFLPKYGYSSVEVDRFAEQFWNAIQPIRELHNKIRKRQP